MSEVSLNNRIASLKRCLLFSSLPESELDSVAAIAVEREFAPGVAIFKEGDNARELYVVFSGRVALQTNLPVESLPLGRRMTVDIVSDGEALGWSAVVAPHLYTMTGVCLQNTSVLAINADALRLLLDSRPHVGYHVMKGMAAVIASRLQDTRQVLISERMHAGRGNSNVQGRPGGN